jgi:hypothetical protein
VAKKETVIALNRKARLAIKGPSKPLDEAGKALVLRLVNEGATLLEAVRREGVGSYGAVWATVDADPAFAVELQKAATKGAAALLNDAQKLSADAAESGDQDAIRAADMYMRCTQSFVEKVAPREYGQLVKLAGDAAQAAITVQVVRFSVPDDKSPENADSA